ncbi:MAG: type II toxin-antitoxin system Phd/YefM family antitoxin [Acidobacteriota bacterium]
MIRQIDSVDGPSSERSLNMKPIQVTQDIVPLDQFKSKASSILKQLKEQNRPVVVTQNGQPAAVLISPVEYDRLQEREQFMAALREGMADSDTGMLIEDGELEEQLEAEFGA